MQLPVPQTVRGDFNVALGGWQLSDGPFRVFVGDRGRIVSDIATVSAP